MKIRKYMRDTSKFINFEDIKVKFVDFFQNCSLPVRRKILCSLLAVVTIITISTIVFRHDFSLVKSSNIVSIDIPQPEAVIAKTGIISVPAGITKAHPFVPYGDNASKSSGIDLPPMVLLEPPTTVGESSDAIRIMDTVVSGILYDKFSPSAILNIEGNDYLVKKGDVVNNYNVLSITQDSVTVKLGSNVYKAGIGQILTEGSLNHNDVSNLNNKFGGDK